jgi:hypothetical protein
MTPKEKAKELVSKMRRDNEMPYQYVKQCALIAVDEILDDYEDYWQQVKQEIINL